MSDQQHEDQEQPQHPEWFKLQPKGPHKKSGGWHPAEARYVWYCAKDGQEWECEAVKSGKAQPWEYTRDAVNRA